MRYTSKKHKKTANIIIITVITAILFAAAVYIRLEKKLGSIVKEAATQQTSELIYNEIDSYLKENTGMGELIHISYDEGGNIVGITTDSASINKINNELGARLSKAMKRSFSTLKTPRLHVNIPKEISKALLSINQTSVVVLLVMISKNYQTL